MEENVQQNGGDMADKEHEQNSYIIRKAEQMTDLAQIALINSHVFKGSNSKISAFMWIQTLSRAEPIYQYFIIADTDQPYTILGYSGWQLHGGWDRTASH